MKRSNDEVEGDSEKLGLKKSRCFDILEVFSRVASEASVGEERLYSENRAICSIGSGSSSDPRCDGLPEIGRCDFNRDHNLRLGSGEKHPFDLNLMPNEFEMGLTDKLKPPLNEKRAEIIDISSDDDNGNDVKHISCSSVYEASAKLFETGKHYDVMENLNLELGLSDTLGVFGESSLAVTKRRYTREEKGKGVAIDPWLSLKTNCPNLDFSPNRVVIDLEDNVTKLVEDDIIDISHQLEVLPEQVPLGQDEQPMQAYGDSMYVQRLRATAWRFARGDLPDKNRGAGSSNQNEIPISKKAVELLGNSCGPFAVALKRVRERTMNKAAAELGEWKTSAENLHHSVTSPFVPSLLDLSLKALAENADKIVSLELVPDVLRRRLTDMVCDARTINSHFLDLLVEGSPTEIRIKNCSWLTDEQFQHSLVGWLTKKLTVLQLDLCGQCMFDLALKEKIARCSSSFSNLAILSLRGACRLSDSGLKTLVMSAPALKSMNLGHCSLLTSDAINFIGDSLGSNLRELYIDDCQKVNAKLVLPAIKKFTLLEVLSVAGLQTVTDQFITDLIAVCGRSIKELDFANCLEITDTSIKAIGNSCSVLHSLNISHLPNLTDVGMEYLANGCRSIQKLDLSRCGFSDEAVAAFLETSGESLVELILNSVVKVGINTALALAKHSRKLVYLDISWCRIISNEALGLIVNSCPLMKLLKVFGCRQITDVFLKGHSNPLVHVIGSSFSSVRDHLNLLEPGEVFLLYSALPNCTEF